jgi:hypothetical protein
MKEVFIRFSLRDDLFINYTLKFLIISLKFINIDSHYGH